MGTRSAGRQGRCSVYPRHKKNWVSVPFDGKKSYDPMFICLNAMPECDKQTDGLSYSYRKLQHRYDA